MDKETQRRKTRKWAAENNLRPTKCELCGETEEGLRRFEERIGKKERRPNTYIVPHHWRGYDFPFDVWWICQRCNRMLFDKHNGEFSKEQARYFIATGSATMSEFVARKVAWWATLSYEDKRDLILAGFALYV